MTKLSCMAFGVSICIVHSVTREDESCGAPTNSPPSYLVLKCAVETRTKSHVSENTRIRVP